MSNFTTIKQKLIVIYLIIVYIIASLVFLNSVYNALFVWYDNDNTENVNDINVPVSTMFGYKILLNSYAVEGYCLNYNRDIILTKNINTLLFKVFYIICVFFILIMVVLYLIEFFVKSTSSPIANNDFFEVYENYLKIGLYSAIILFFISNNFNNPGKKYYDKYEDDESTFENYLYGEYAKIADTDKGKNCIKKLKQIFKNTNKNNFYDMNIDDYFENSETYTDEKFCYDILKLCKKLCNINKDTNIDVVEVFRKFIDNCEKSFIDDDSLNNIVVEEVSIDTANGGRPIVIAQNTNFNIKTIYKKSELLKYSSEFQFDGKDYIKYDEKSYQVKNKSVDKVENFLLDIKEFFRAYLMDLTCIFGELQFLKNNFKSIFSLLLWEDNGMGENIDKINSKVGLEPIFFSSLLTKQYLKECGRREASPAATTINQYDGNGKYFAELGKYTMNADKLTNADRSFIELMDDAKRSTYFDLFVMKGLLSGAIIFTFANIVLKEYYNKNPEGKKTLLEIDKKIILSKIDDSFYDIIKYEKFIKPLLKEGNYIVNIVLSIIIILLLLKLIPHYSYPVKAIQFNTIDCNSKC